MKALFLISILFTINLTAQVNAPVKVTVTNSENIPITNDKINFIGKKSKKIISGITNSKGQFLIQLPSGDIYEIRIVGLGEDKDYSTLEVPKANEGQQFQEMLIEIMYEPETSFIVANLNFETAKASINASSFKVLDDIAETLIRKKNLKIIIEGHTDSDGDDAANLKLSLDRANEVKAYLVKKGVDEKRIKTKGNGETKPIASNETALGKATNRRTEINIQ